MIGFHYQGAVNNHLEAIKKLPVGTWIKAIDNVQLLSECKGVNPGLKTVLRHWTDQPTPALDYEKNKEAARAFFRTFIDGTFRNYARQVDAIEDWNEYFANSQSEEERSRFVSWARACMDVWYNEYRRDPAYSHIRLVVANTAVGNDIPLEVAQSAVQYDAILGYHCYWPTKGGVLWTDGQTPPSWWHWYAGRFAQMDAHYKANGVDVSKLQWLSTETGPVGHSGASLDPMAGWRQAEVCNGNTDCYIDSIRQWLDRVTDWNKSHGNRMLGGVLFTTGGGSLWKHFETKMPEMERIAEFAQAYQPKPIDPVDPPLPANVDGQLWAFSVAQQKSCGITLNSDAGLQKAIVSDGYMPVTRELYPAIDGKVRVIQPAESLNGRPRRVYEWVNGRARWFYEPS